jgi:hypothetical protein
MSHKLARLLATMTAQEQAEIEIFAAFLVARRQVQALHLATDDIPVEEMMSVVAASGSFDWLGAEEEDVYSIADGEAVRWA